MMHETDGRLMAFLDRELSGPDAAAVEAHVAACESCAAELETLAAGRRRLGGALPVAPEAELAAASERVRARIAERQMRGGRAGAPPRSAPARPAPRWARRSRVLQAAVLVLFLAGGAAALVPGSPLRRLIEGERPAPASAPAPLRAPEAQSSAINSIAASAADGRLRVALDLPAGTDLQVGLVEGERAVVHAPQDTRFRSGDGLIEATVTGGPVRVELPRGVADVSLVVGGQVYLTVRFGRMDASVPAADSSDAEITFRIR